ncbi:uncharacterized protein [Asterias amurensis]|uniref:uncharacterized protein n=1 Tax=Asterias amurensis TaxID=7602 RepID=UPI003AB58CAD
MNVALVLIQPVYYTRKFTTMCHCKCCDSWAHCWKYTCRLVVAILCLPFLLVISLVAILVAIIICPLKCCCPCCAPCLDCILKGVTFLLKAPFLFVMWSVKMATGDDDDDEEKQQLPKHAAEYGTSDPPQTKEKTDESELKELDEPAKTEESTNKEDESTHKADESTHKADESI